MSLLLPHLRLAERRAIAASSMAPLADGLRSELSPLLTRLPDPPRDKALLSRTGGRCARDGTLLTFDPFDPRHRCPRCGVEAAGELHDRFRPYWYQLWLAERVVHCALIGVLRDDAGCVDSAVALLDAFAARYLEYPNADNVLGPSRPFFSTYLESIWLLQLMVGLDLLESGAGGATVTSLGARVRDRMIEPSIALIASYDEGMSNRQVWNNAALLAGGILLARPELVDRVLDGDTGLQAHLRQALLEDGSWYEGENYHLFAHRGLWYGVVMSDLLGRRLPAALAHRFDEGFAAPFRTLLPDLTYPSRRDSQYAVSVRQPRFAESCELGLARRDDPRLIGMLAKLYDASQPRRDTGRIASTADVERNLPATGLTRADLSWRTLLLARAELPALGAEPLRSDLLAGQGFGILRREGGRVYVGLDYGHSGGGHGHPDRLNLLLSDGEVRWFDDPGTGSYVEESLHWYRSTLAHSAPLVDGRSQPAVHGVLEAFEDRGDAGWLRASAPLQPGLAVTRTLVVMADYLVDVVEWAGERPHDVALPLHGVAVREAGVSWVPSVLEAGSERTDGFPFLRDVAAADQRLPAVVALVGEPVSDAVLPDAGSEEPPGEHSLDGWLAAPGDATWWRAQAPGAPGRSPRPLLLVRASGRVGRLVSVWSWRGLVEHVELRGDLIVCRHGGATHEHRSSGSGWLVTTHRDAGTRTVELGGRQAAPRPTVQPVPRSSGAAPGTGASGEAPRRLPARFWLGVDHYRRSEQSWEAAGRPTACIELDRDGAELLARVVVPDSVRRFVAIDADNLYDNEPAAINGDGIQLYVESAGLSAGWLLVPIPEGTDVAVRPVAGWQHDVGVDATWAPIEGGYELRARITLPREACELSLDIIVNEIGPDRVRRRGQLILSGANGEFVYLRGDRHDPGRLLRFSLADD